MSPAHDERKGVRVSNETENRIIRALAEVMRENPLSFRRTADHWARLLPVYAETGDLREVRAGLHGDHLGDVIENYNLAPESAEVTEAIPALRSNVSEHGTRSFPSCDDEPWVYPNGFREHEPEHEDAHNQSFRVAIWAPRSRDWHLSGQQRTNLPLAQFRAAYAEGDVPIVALATNWIAYEVMEGAASSERAWSTADIDFARTVLQRIIQVFS